MLIPKTIKRLEAICRQGSKQRYLVWQDGHLVATDGLICAVVPAWPKDYDEVPEDGLLVPPGLKPGEYAVLSTGWRDPQGNVFAMPPDAASKATPPWRGIVPVDSEAMPLRRLDVDIELLYRLSAAICQPNKLEVALYFQDQAEAIVKATPFYPITPGAFGLMAKLKPKT